MAIVNYEKEILVFWLCRLICIDCETSRNTLFWGYLKVSWFNEGEPTLTVPTLMVPILTVPTLMVSILMVSSSLSRSPPGIHPNSAHPNCAHPNGIHLNGACPNAAHPISAHPNSAHPNGATLTVTVFSANEIRAFLIYYVVL